MTMDGTQTQTAHLKITAQTVEELSQARGEPDWLLHWRLEAWEAAQRLPMPSSRYTQVRGLDLGQIEPLTRVSKEATLTVPEELKALLEPGEAAGLYVQLDGQVLAAKLPDELKKKGVLFADITVAVREHPELVRAQLAKLPAPADRIAALQRALFASGLFLYVPKGVAVKQPLKAVYLLTQPGAGLFTQSFVIAESNSTIMLLEECASPQGELERPALQAGNTLLSVGQGAQVSFAGVQSWNPRVFHFVRRRGIVAQDGRLQWTFGWLGGRLTMSHIETVLDGPGAEVDDVQVFFATDRQHMDLTSNLLHQKPHTRGEVNVKGVLKGKSQAVFWGLIRIEPGAQGSNAFQSERSLILEEGPRSNAIPSLEIEANDVRCTHAAATSQIDEEQLFYLRSRGLPEDEAKKLIVEGFFEPIIEKISLPLVQTRLRMLIDHKWRSGR